ncbi:MAG: signal peptidase I [Pseudomonadota bacterium]
MAAAETGNPIWETVKTVVYAILIALVFRTLFFQPFFIPSGSMKDTLLIGDFLFVNKMAYGYSQYSCDTRVRRIEIRLCPFVEGRIFGSDPDRGDVIVFRHPVLAEEYIKRVIGLPGDRIRVENGVVFLNGEPAPQTAAPDFVEVNDRQGAAGEFPQCNNGPVAIGGDCTKERFTETLPGDVTHSILNIRDNGAGDFTDEFIVPEGHVFVMGDNRDNSIDSRFPQRGNGVGMVPMENIIGRADRVIFSAAGQRIIYFWTWRADRFFRAVE